MTFAVFMAEPYYDYYRNVNLPEVLHDRVVIEMDVPEAVPWDGGGSARTALAGVGGGAAIAGLALIGVSLAAPRHHVMAAVPEPPAAGRDAQII